MLIYSFTLFRKPKAHLSSDGSQDCLFESDIAVYRKRIAGYRKIVGRSFRDACKRSSA
jgi:hypothetical protein